MRDLIVVGAGEVFEKYWLPTIQKSDKAHLAGIVESRGLRLWSLTKIVPNLEEILSATSIDCIPDDVSRDTIVLVLTPDHFPVVKELAEKGFQNIVVEKPLVSRDHELPLILELAEQYALKLYSVDMYLPKAFSLAVILRKVNPADPRCGFFAIGATEETANLLGDVEGATVSVIECGDFGLPSLDRRPWLEHDAEVGGMLRDLGTHAFAPLVNAGLLSADAEVCSAMLAKFTPDRLGIEPVTNRNDVEMYISAQLSSRDLPIHTVFGKLPQKGGEWSLVVRGSKGMFYSSLRSGQPGIVVGNNGETKFLKLSVSPMEFVLEEICMFYSGLLPGFDGNVGAVSASLALNQKIRDAYFSSR